MIARGMYRVSSLYRQSLAPTTQSRHDTLYLVEKDILPVPALCREVFKIAILADAVLQT